MSLILLDEFHEHRSQGKKNYNPGQNYVETLAVYDLIYLLFDFYPISTLITQPASPHSQY